MTQRESAARLIERIMAKCVEDAGCLIWQGACADGTSPQIRVGRRLESVRRVLWEARTGRPIPTGVHMAVTCECRLCIKHFEPQSISQISQRVAARGAYAAPVHGPRISKGRKHLNKLSDQQVEEVRSSSEKGTLLAVQYDISESYVSAIRSGKARKNYSSPFAGLGGR